MVLSLQTTGEAGTDWTLLPHSPDGTSSEAETIFAAEIYRKPDAAAGLGAPTCRAFTISVQTQAVG